MQRQIKPQSQLERMACRVFLAPVIIAVFLAVTAWEALRKGFESLR